MEDIVSKCMRLEKEVDERTQSIKELDDSPVSENTRNRSIKINKNYIRQYNKKAMKINKAEIMYVIIRNVILNF